MAGIGAPVKARWMRWGVPGAGRAAGVRSGNMVQMHDPETAAQSEAAHDILAAEEFGVPAADPELHHGPLVVPDDPSGISEPHDILAAEEFPMPAARPHPAAVLASRRGGWVRLAVEVLAVAGLLAALARRRRG